MLAKGIRTENENIQISRHHWFLKNFVPFVPSLWPLC